MRKRVTKKAAPAKAAPPVEAPAEPEKKAAPAKAKAVTATCTRPFRAGGRLYERGVRYEDVPASVHQRFGHRFD